MVQRLAVYWEHRMPDSHSAAYRFDLDGGRVCLDFANTGSSSVDRLTTYADLVAFAQQSLLLTPETAAWLHAEAERCPARATATLERATSLRQALRGIFMAIARGARPTHADLDVLNAELAASLVHARILPDEARETYAWGWTEPDLNSPLWPIVRSAADVLTSDHERPLVRECGAADCVWLFMDATRNRSRQWCSMTSCGNREKARRHYRRLKAQRTEDAAAQPQASGATRAQRPGRRKAAAPAVDASATVE